MNTCFMFGNRRLPSGAEKDIEEAVHRAVKRGIDEFIVGSRGEFDMAATTVVRRVKMKCPEIRLYLLLAYLSAEKVSLPEGFDGIIYPDGMEKVPLRFAIVKANRWAIVYAQHVIGYVRDTTGNSWRLMKFALGKGVSFENIGQKNPPG